MCTSPTRSRAGSRFSSARLVATTLPWWNNLPGRDLLTLQTTAVTLHGCDGIGSYPAMTVLQKATCVTLRLDVDGIAPTDITLPFFGATCSLLDSSR